MVRIQKSTFRQIKKTALLIFLFFQLISNCFAQSLVEVNKVRNRTVKNGMLVLGSWSLANIAYAPFAAANSSGENKYFHEMNGYWNLINLGLSGVGYIAASKYDPSKFGLAESLSEHNKLEKTLLFNAGLDLAYIAGGFYLKERALNVNERSEMFSGFGNSIILQGAFLFVFDLSFYAVLKRHDNAYNKLISGLGVNANGLTFQYRF